jgi:Spy/CpxP family protein refolding chaperone
MKVAMAVRLGVAIAALLPCTLLAAQAPMGGPGQGMGAGFGQYRAPFEKALGPQGKSERFWNRPEVVEKLKLSDEQRKAMDKILLDHRATLIDLHANVQKAELAMEPLMSEEQPNEGKILAAIDKLAQARAELEKANARFLLALRGQLKPEQWKSLQELRAARQEGRGWGGEGKGGVRPQGQFRQHRQAPPAPPTGGPQSMEQGGSDRDVAVLDAEQ